MGRKNKSQRSDKVPSEDRGMDANEGLDFSAKKEKKQDLNIDREKKEKRQ